MDPELLQMARRLADFFAGVAPEVYAMMVRAAFYQSLGMALAAAVSLPLGVLLIRRAMTTYARVQEIKEQHGRYTDKVDGIEILVPVFAVLGACAVITGVILLCDIWLYVGLFEPELRLVHDLLAKVGG